jgi:hypothetical protein
MNATMPQATRRVAGFSVPSAAEPRTTSSRRKLERRDRAATADVRLSSLWARESATISRAEVAAMSLVAGGAAWAVGLSLQIVPEFAARWQHFENYLAQLLA